MLELLEDGDKVSLYSPKFEGETYTEFEKFLLKYKDEYPQDIAQIGTLTFVIDDKDENKQDT